MKHTKHSMKHIRTMLLLSVALLCPMAPVRAEGDNVVSRIQEVIGGSLMTPAVQLPQPVEETGPRIVMENSLVLSPKSQYWLNITVPEDNGRKPAYKLTSSDEKVVTVNREGRVTAKGIGSAVITCTLQNGSGIDARCAVTVRYLAQELNIHMSDPVVITEGMSRQLLAAVSPALAERSIAWQTSAPEIVSIADGWMTAVKPGAATLTASTVDGTDLHASVNVIVEPIQAVRITGIQRRGNGFSLTGCNQSAVRMVRSFQFLLSRTNAADEPVGTDVLCQWQAGEAVKPGDDLPAGVRWQLALLPENQHISVTVTQVMFDDGTCMSIPPQQRVTISEP